MQSLDQLLSPTLDLLIGHINQVVIMASSTDLRKAITQQPDGTLQQMEGGECTLALKICLVRSSFSLAQSALGPQHIHVHPPGPLASGVQRQAPPETSPGWPSTSQPHDAAPRGQHEAWQPYS